MQPKKTKYKKYYKPRQFSKLSNSLQTLNPVSCFTLIARESSYINGKQIEAARQTIRRKLKKRGQLKILVFPDIGISTKSTASRMGKGKDEVNYLICKINAGKPIFQLLGVSTTESLIALQAGSNKLPIKLKICQQ